MIPTIGLMVAAIGIVVCLYVIWRILGDEGKDNWFRAGVGAVTFLVAVAAILVLVLFAWSLLVGSVEFSTFDELR